MTSVVTGVKTSGRRSRAQIFGLRDGGRNGLDPVQILRPWGEAPVLKVRTW